MGLLVDIKKRFKGFELNVNFEGIMGRIGLLGASGSGKSMTLRCIAGLVRPDEGKIIVNGNTFFDSEKRINIKPKNRKVGFLFQNYALFPHLTVYDNIAFGLSGLSPNDQRLKVNTMIEKFSLMGLENRYPREISGGQQQRTALARVIAPEPEILLLDEPFSALDEHLRAHMIKEMLEFLKEFGGTTLFVTHNMEEAYRLCENLAVLSRGEIHAFGAKKDVFENPPTIETAKITGCKNIVEAVRIDDEHIKIPSWNIRLKTNSKTSAKSGFFGIRANHIKLCNEDNSDNIFKVKVVGNMESPFRQMVYLKFEQGLNDSSDYHIQWEISKDVWEKVVKESNSIDISLPKDKIMYCPN